MIKAAPMPYVESWRLYAKCRFGQIHITAAEPTSNQPKTHSEEKPPLVCFHTSPLSGTEFKEFQHIMAEDRLVLCPDTPGFGRSDPPPHVPVIGDYSGAMADMLEDLGYGAKGRGAVDVLGCRTGSLVAIDLAATRPDLVRKVTLTCVALLDDAQRIDIRAQFGAKEPIFSDPQYMARSYRHYVLDGPIEVSEERRYEIFIERLRAGSRSWWGPEAVVAYDAATRLKTLPHPTLLLVVKCLLAENTRRAAKLVTKPTVVDIENQMTKIDGDTGTEPWSVQSPLLASKVRSFLDAH